MANPNNRVATMILNQQKSYALPGPILQAYVRRLKRQLRLGTCDFNVCFVNDEAMRRMNGEFRGQDRATDVLSFAWSEPARTQVVLRSKSRRGPPGRPVRSSRTFSATSSFR